MLQYIGQNLAPRIFSGSAANQGNLGRLGIKAFHTLTNGEGHALKRGTHHVCLGGVWIEANIGPANIRVHYGEPLPYQIGQAHHTLGAGFGCFDKTMRLCVIAISEYAGNPFMYVAGVEEWHRIHESFFHTKCQIRSTGLVGERFGRNGGNPT